MTTPFRQSLRRAYVALAMTRFTSETSAADDVTIFEHADHEERVIVSADTDFGTILAMRNTARPSVILFRGATPRSPIGQVNLLLANLGEITPSIERGAVVVLEPRRIRVRTLPICPS